MIGKLGGKTGTVNAIGATNRSRISPEAGAARVGHR